MEVTQKLEDGLGGVGVQGAGGLITEQDVRLVGQCPGDGHTLLLTTRELCGVVVCQVRQSDQGQKFGHPGCPLRFPHTAPKKGKLHIACHGAGGHQIEVLEDHPGALPEGAQIGRIQVAHLPSPHPDTARVIPLQAIDAPNQSGLSGSAQADDAEDVPLLDTQGDISQGRLVLFIVTAICLGEITNLHRWCLIVHLPAFHVD